MDKSTVSTASDVPADSSILYELLVYSEWKQDPELPKRLSENQEGLSSLLKNAFALRSCEFRHEQVERLLSWQQPWRLCVGDGGKVVALLQDSSLEIRSSRDEYSSVIAKATLPKDLFPQWRRWCWSPDCTMLAVGLSNGAVRVYDLMGSNLFSIVPSMVQQEQTFTSTRHSLASCFFLQARSSTHKWSSELVTVDYSGQLHSYLVSPTEGFQENHSFSFGVFFRSGVTAVAYHPAHSLLFVAGPVMSRGNMTLEESGDRVGLTTWRILNDHPFYQLVNQDKKYESTSLSSGLWRIPYFGSKHQQSVIIRLEISPSARRIAALHSCGGISVWSLPGVRLLGYWPLVEQPDWNAQNPLNVEAESPNGKRSAGLQAPLSNESFSPVDLDWWSDEALVVVRNSGAVTVCEISNLQNLLGESPEFLAGSAQVRRFHNEKGFLALECDVDVFCKSRLNDDETFEEESVSELSDEEEDIPTTLFQRVITIVNSVAYLVTDLERFRPRRRRLRLCRRTYRLLALRSTTPEELYSRKLDNEEYGEALTLAHTYNLDCDLVYQRQWRNNKVSVATIRDYLSKVSNQTWVLRECLDRVPESLLAARELVEFGLKATSKEAFRNLGSKRKVKDVDEMTDKQKEFLLCRHTLLRYQDRLTMYEKILGGTQLADELFEHTVYAVFRASSSLRACVQFARAANSQAVECMLTYEGSQTLHHWLPILSNFPETVCPTEYKSLLPELTHDGVVFSWQETQLRELDWSEKDPYGCVRGLDLDTPDKDTEWLYEYEPGLSAYRIPVEDLTPKLIQQWYLERIRMIERSSRMVDNALVLLRLALDNHIEGLGDLHQELQILDALVYELFLEDVSLADLEKKSPLEKCKLLMSKTTENSFLEDMSRLLFPYVERVEKEQPGMKYHLLHDYLISVSSESLTLPLKFFEGQDELSCGLTPDEISTIAIDCIYSYVDTDHLHLAQGILAAIPVQRVLTVSHTEQLDALELELAASLILRRNGTAKSLGYIRDNKSDAQLVTQLLTRLSRTVANRNPPPSEVVWSTLLGDILDLQRSVFTCVPPSTCYEVFCSTLLSSGNMASIKLSGNYINPSAQSRGDLRSETYIPADKCTELVLSAAREYMDSAGSLTDPAMDFARACLHLLPSEDPEIQEERNLLYSFQLLHEFGIKMLPIQVRLCPDRLKLIEDCLKKKSGAHRNPSKILQLAACLNINNNNPKERQGRVLVLVAEAAFHSKDYRSCADTCKRLVDASYTDGWSIASEVASCSEFKDVATRSHLLSFALQYCPTEVLQDLVNRRRSLEIESLQEGMKNQIAMHNSSLSVHLEGQVGQAQSESFGMDFLQNLPFGESSVQETTQRLLSSVGDSQFWKKALRIGWDDSAEDDALQSTTSPEHYTCHAFYSSLYDATPYSTSRLGCRYDCFSAPDIPPQLQFEQALLRIALFEQESGSNKLDITKVLSECAISVLPEDNCLGLGYLMSLPESCAREASRQVFEANISSVTLQLAQYYAALRWYRNAVNGDREKMHNVLLYDPREVISLAAQDKNKDDIWQPELLRWRAQLADYVQAQDLLTLDCGVDVSRFASDEQYRHDSILGLAMHEDSERLRFALALAARHGVDRGQVVAEHIANLLLSELSDSEVKQRLSGTEFENILEEASDAIKEKLETHVFSNIDGTQLCLLELYYTILSKVAPSHRSARLLPKDHLKLLSKVKATTAVIDYKLLISGPKNTIKAVESSLTVENIPLVAKLLKAMPAALASPLSASVLYTVYLKSQLSKNVSVEKLVPILANIKAEDIMPVIESTFLDKTPSTASLPLELAEELIAATLLNCDFAGSEPCMEQLAHWKGHVRTSRWLMENWPEEECCKQYLHTNGEKEDLISLLRDTFLNDQKSARFLLDLLKVTSSACSLSEEMLMLDVFKNHVDAFQNSQGDSFAGLNAALLRLEQLAQLGKLQGNIDEWDEILRPLATNEQLPPDQKLKVFNIIQQNKSEKVQEPSLLFFHTQAILASSWPQIPVLNGDIEDEDRRCSLLIQLIQNTNSWQQRQSLQRLLDLWPPFSDSCESVSVLYSQLLMNCVLCESGQWTDQKASFIIDISSRYLMSYDHLDKFLSEVQSKTEQASNDGDETEDDDTEPQVDVQLLILICLLSNDSKAHRKAVSLAQQWLTVPFHDKVAEVALSRNLTVDLLSTPAYSDLLSSVIASQPSSVESIVKTLLNRRHIPEAGAVILRSIHSVPSFMRTFSSSLMMGLKQTAPSVVANIKPVDKVIEHKVSKAEAESSVLTSPETRACTDTDWDAGDNDWSDVEENETEQKDVGGIVDEPTRREIRSAKEKRVQEQQDAKVKANEWSNQDGWGGWSDEELERIDAEKENCEGFNDKDVMKRQKHISPPLLPSPQSAFARVPPRDQATSSAPLETSLDKQSEDELPPAALPNAASDWDDEDWGAGWDN
ncbi:neuroblastoma-amplified sequence-like isoform X2 [Thrips palmi]|uniref:Neuroblastoma-amplified sequence-like isoform X2 n=1 Tax=Thrips palmi TaxID=161013 RepID=A0A6P8Z557_THRPL|nr:neuroblastoma-amplified sequence-like isoform X2 [Thrips palmi]